MGANEWANYSVIAALTLGFLMVSVAAMKAVLGRGQSFLQPDIACVLFMWSGYHLSPLIAIATASHWRAFMLSTSHIEESLWMSLAAMICFLFGFRILKTRDDQARFALQSWSDRSIAILNQGNHISKLHIWLLATLVFTCFVITAGGFSELWNASYDRGAGNWLERTLEVRLIRLIAVLLPVMSMALIAVAAISSVSSERSFSKNFTIISALFIASINSLHSFSRGAGVAFLSVAVIRFVLLGRRDWKVFLLASFAALWVGYVGYEYRSEYNPGIGNYLEAAARSFMEVPEFDFSSSQNEELLKPEDNLLSATEAYTAVSSYLEQERISPFEDILEFVFNLHPFPSGLVGLADRGVELTEVFHTRGNVGLTTPTLADLYVTFGPTTPLFYFALGLLYHFMLIQIRNYGPMVEPVLLLLLFVAWPISLHSSFRAQWRIINLVIILLVILYLLKRRGYFQIKQMQPVRTMMLPSRPAPFRFK